MTYPKNNTAPTAAMAKNKLSTKNAAGGGNAKNSGSGNLPTSTPPLSTNYNHHKQHHQPMQRSFPRRNSISSATSTRSNDNVSSFSSARSKSFGSNSGYFATIRNQLRKQKQRRWPPQHQNQLNDADRRLSFPPVAGKDKISPTHHLIPTSLTHFATSKCFASPKPSALPKPPKYWIESKASEKVASNARRRP